MLSRSLIALALLSSVGCVGRAQVGAPDRTVRESSVTSAHDPAVRITVPSSASYVGADRFVLYNNADCEIHVFVDGDAAKNVTSLYWIQFEGFISSNPFQHHTYDSPRHATLGGWDFYVDTWASESGAPVRPGSDSEAVRKILQAKGYKRPPGMMYVRLVHLLDGGDRKELMIIYGEDLPAGMTAASLQEGGANFSRWPSLEQGLIERAKKQITVEPLQQH